MIYIKVNNVLYPAKISGMINDKDWGGRESKAVTVATDFSTLNALFVDNISWSIVDEINTPTLDENGNAVLDNNGEPTYTTQQREFDNSEFSIRGDLTVHTDGTCTVRMGKLTELEQANAALDELVLAELGGAE